MLSLLAIGVAEPAWAAEGSWIGQVARQTIARSDRPLQGDVIAAPSHITGGEISRIRWALRLDQPAPALKIWLCQARYCVPLAGLRGETPRFAGRSAAVPLQLRFQWPAGRQRDGGSLVVTGGQLIVDYRDADK